MKRFRQTRLPFSDVVIAAAISATAAVAVYVNSLHGRMVFDDFPAIVNNPDVVGRGPLSAIFANNFWGQPMDAPDVQHQSYRPLTTLTFRWNHQAHGLDPEGYHLVNVALHMVATVLFVFVAAHVAAQPSFAYLVLVGVLFGVHPVHVEAVSGLVGRADLLAGIFFLAALLLYFEACASRKAQRQLVFTTATVVAVGLSVLCKETGITAVAVATVYDLAVVYRLDPRSLIGLDTVPPSPPTSHAVTPQSSSEVGAADTSEATGGSEFVPRAEHDLPAGSFGLRHRRASNTDKAPPRVTPDARSVSSSTTGLLRHVIARQAVLWIGCGLVLFLRLRLNTVDIQVDAKTNPANHIKDPTFRMLTKNLYVVLHGWLLLYPKDLCCDWAGGSIPPIDTVSDIRIFGIGAFYLGIIFLLFEGSVALSNRRWRAELLVGMSLFIVPFMPATGLFMEVGFVLAERILYIPSMGFCLVTAAVINRLAFPSGFRWWSQIGTLMVLGILLYSGKTVLRNSDWKDEVSLFGSGVRVAPNNAKLHHNYAYYAEDRVKEFHLREAIRLYPPYISAYTNLGVHLARAHRGAEAIDVYKKGLEMHRKYPLYSTDVGVIHHNMAQSHLVLGDNDKALRTYKDCLKAKPSDSRCQQWANDLGSAPKKRPASASNGALSPFDKVLKVTDDTFLTFRKENPKSFLMFFAPWCSHCNEMKGEYAKLQTTVVGQVAVGSVDCTQALDVCTKKVKVAGYPQLVFYRSADDKDGTMFQGERVATAMAAFLAQEAGFKLGATAKVKLPPQSSGRSGFDALTKLTKATEKYFRRKHGNRLVMFYAPWCTHCTDVKPVFAEAAEIATEVTFAAVDCTTDESLCTDAKVTAYPTLAHFSSSDDTSPRLFQGEKATDAIVRFVRQQDTAEASFGTDAVVDFDGDAIHRLEQDGGLALVMWHAPWCSHCQETKPAFGMAATRLRQSGSKVLLASVDCTAHSHICSEMKISAYPTFLGFVPKLDSPSKFDGGRDPDSFVAEATRLEKM